MGSVAYFSGDAIVNAANESCQGGGGVDGAVTMWGGEALKKARFELKKLGRSRTKRCNTGSAVTTTAGELPCSHVVHGVGPNYKDYRNSDDADKLLASAYESSVREASRVGARSLACSLLSAGIYRAKQSLGHVLQVGLKSVQKASRELKDKSPKELFFVAFTQEEKDALIK
jgi:O-acetyl-ADP-ribose deacetylase (regulator of RNase III)